MTMHLLCSSAHLTFLQFSVLWWCKRNSCFTRLVHGEIKLNANIEASTLLAVSTRWQRK